MQKPNNKKGMRKHLKVVNYERPCKKYNDGKRNLKHIILQTLTKYTLTKIIYLKIIWKE